MAMIVKNSTSKSGYPFVRAVCGHYYWELSKGRPRVLVATCGAAFVHGSSGNIELARLYWTCTGTMMVAALANSFNQVHGFPTTQLHSSRAFNTSKILPIHTSISLEQSTGSKVSVDEVILFKQSLQVRIHEAMRLGNTKMTINLLCHLGSMEDSLTSEDCMFLLESCWRFPDPEYALELWRLMDEKRLEIKRSGYLCILRALTKGGYLDEALYLLKSLGESSCGKAGLYMCDIFLNGCSEYRSLVHAKSCLELIENRCIGKSETTYIELMKMHRLGLEPLQATYNAYLKAVIVARGVIHGMEVVSAMKSKNVKPNNITYAALAVGYSKIQQLDWAEAMLEQMDEKQPQHIYPFNSLLAACCKANEPERAIRVITRMRLVNVKPNLNTYEMMFFLFGNVNSPYERGDQMSQEAVSKRIATIEMDMARNGVEHSRKSVTNLIDAIGRS